MLYFGDGAGCRRCPQALWCPVVAPVLEEAPAGLPMVYGCSCHTAREEQGAEESGRASGTTQTFPDDPSLQGRLGRVQ